MNRSTVILLSAALALAAREGSAQDARASHFSPERAVAAPRNAQPPSPTFIGKAMQRDAKGGLIPIVRRKPAAAPSSRQAVAHPARVLRPESAAFRPSTLSDYYVQDGSETALALNPWNLQNLVAGFNEGWDFDPDIPLSASTLGTAQWNSRPFPLGTGVYGGYPFNPWCIAQNAPGQFLSSLIRRDLQPSDNARVVIARSIDSGGSFTKWHEVAREVF